MGWHTMLPGDWELRGAINTNWTFYCNDAAGAEIITPDGITPLPAGRLVLVPASMRFDARCRARLRHFFGYFTLQGIPHHRIARLTRPLLTPAAAEDALLARLGTAVGERPTPSDQLRLAARIISGLAEVLPTTVLEAADAADHQLAPALRLINDRFRDSIANRDLARACGLSANTFLRRFRDVTGTTPTQALRLRRVHAAGQLLLEGDAPLDVIAKRCGLATRPYLVRVFTAVLGMSPGTYRRVHRMAQVPLGEPGDLRWLGEGS
jgi:AraC-like DNA-binding protein